MKPIRLTMTAFGPYAGTEVVDFSALEASIFGIYGETGVGKTTVFDGISFALFGQSSGAERAPEDMVCHHDHAKEITKVELVFDLGEDRYVIRRIPVQQRAALRGSGTTTQAHEAYLFRATGMKLEKISEDNPGEVLAEKKVGLVDAQVEELLGYNAKQFRQIILLPQGDFRRILTASSDERSPILKQLFDVGLYETFAAQIKARAATLYRQISDEKIRRSTLLDDQSEDQLSRAIQSMIGQIAVLDTTIETETRALEKRQKGLSAGEALAEKFKALATAREEDSELQAEGETIDAVRIRLKQARAAQHVLVSEAALQTARDENAIAATREHEARNNLNSATDAITRARETLSRTHMQKEGREGAQARVSELQRQQVTLDQSKALLEELNAAKLTSQTAEEAKAAADQKNVEAQQALSALRDLQKQHPQHIRALQEATTAMSALDAESQALDQFETAVLKRDRQSKEVDRLSIQHDEALEQLEAAKAAFEHAEQDLTEIQALHVARKLKPGEPCPACGALNHPNPAGGDPERRGRHDEFERAGKILRSAENDELEARTTLAAAKAALVERQNEVDALERPKRDRAALAPILLAVREKKTALEADNRFADLEGKISFAEAFASDATQALENAQSTVSDAKGVEVRAQTAYDTTLKGVPDELRPVNALSEALSAAIAKRDQLAADHEAAVTDEKDAAVVFSAAEEAAKIAQNGVAKTSEGLKKAQGEFFGQLEKVGLNEEAFQAAKNDVAQYSVLEAQISDYENRVAAITARLRGLTEDIGDQPTPDLTLLTKARNEARAALEQSRDAQSRLKNELDGRQQVLGQVQRLTTQINDLEKEYGPVGGLSDLVNGNNDRKVRLPDFAIAAMFDEVLLAANHRLGPMTDGRYQLMRPEVTGDGRQKQGLEISVFDGNTEKSRPTKTLSGGEGFQASLALALGLSDVVQRNSGGIKLDAIFIDEGFGTLDEDTLNTALETLYDLTNDMRSVGLISHTEQVKTMITEGFAIEITPTGSHIHPRRNAS